MPKIMMILLLCLIDPIICNEFNDELEYSLQYLTNRMGFCFKYFKYIRVNEFALGRLTMPNLKMNDTVKLQFQMNYIYYNYRFNGSLLPDDEPQEVINKIENSQPITFRIDFPLAYAVPDLLRIYINGNNLCATTYTSTKDPFQELILEYKLQIINGTMQVFRHNINIPYFARLSTCGLDDTEIATNNSITPYIYGGKEVRRGEYPWMAALFRNKTTGPEFICSGSLLTTEIILTAAHCFHSSKASDIEIFLGLYNISNTAEEGVVKRQIESIILHPEYNMRINFSDADLALLKLKEPVGFTKYIKPICLWNESPDESLIVGHSCVVAGWGVIENGTRAAEVPKKVKVNFVAAEECLRSAQIFSLITSSRTFCAGNRDGSGPCEGDSGGGLMIYRSGVWMLRGVISAGVTYQQRCNLQMYTVYCDIAKHYGWLEHYIGPQDQPITGEIANICGKAGDETQEKHPWLAAVYLKVPNGLAFRCSGALISSRSVLVEANCFMVDKFVGPNGADYLRVYLGRYDLNNIKENKVVSRDVAAFVRHPKYKIGTSYIYYENDLALLQLKKPVSFSQYVKPICLWTENLETLKIVEQPVTLLSWDILGVYNESLTVPQSQEVKIVSITQCQLEGYAVDTATFYLCTPNFGNNMDGILQIKHNGTWWLRGIATANIIYLEIYNSTQYRLYTDLTGHLLWIRRSMLL